MIKTVMACAALSLVFAAAPARAETIAAAGMTPVEVVAWLTAKGLPAHIDKERDTASLLFVDVTSEEVNWEVDFYDCDKTAAQRCTSIQFSAGWEGTYTNTIANNWNRDFRYLKSHVSDDGKAAWVQFDIKLTQGTTIGQLDELLGLWRARLPTFADSLKPPAKP